MATDIAVVDELLSLLENSEESGYAGVTISELTEQVESAKSKIELGDRTGYRELQILCAPTGALQETSIDNGWGDEFLAIAARIG